MPLAFLTFFLLLLPLPLTFLTCSLLLPLQLLLAFLTFSLLLLPLQLPLAFSPPATLTSQTPIWGRLERFVRQTYQSPLLYPFKVAPIEVSDE